MPGPPKVALRDLVTVWDLRVVVDLGAGDVPLHPPKVRDCEQSNMNETTVIRMKAA